MSRDYYEFPINMKPQRWKKHMLFTGVRDDTFFEATGGAFPACRSSVPNKTHPIFVLGFADGTERDEEGVLKYRASGPLVCPGSTKNWNDKEDRRYLRAGALTSTHREIKEVTYLAEEHTFVVPRGMRYIEEFEEKYTNVKKPRCLPLFCMGVVENEDIIEGMWYVH